MPGTRESTTWRSHFPVLVTPAQTIGGIGVIRSLGRGGYPVHAVSSQPNALGFLSRYATASAVCPECSDASYLDWLRAYVERHGIKGIIPSEAMLLALRPAFSEFSRLLPFSRDEDTVYQGMSKFDLFESLRSPLAPDAVRGHLPPTLFVNESDPLPDVAALESLGSPLFLKVDGCHSRLGSGGTVHKAGSGQQARVILGEIARDFRKILVQGYVPGVGVGAFFLLWKGQALAEFMHRRLHESPHTGGVSSLRESWWHPEIRDDALAKLKHFGWEGVAMLEYRWDPATDRFHLMEMNGRFWGSLHLALYAGVDFPLLLMDAFHGRVPAPVKQFRLGVRCRHTFPFEVGHVLSRVRDRRIGRLSRLWTLLGFFTGFLDFRTYSDLWFPGDRRLYWVNLKRFCKETLGSVIGKIFRRRH